MRLTTRQKTQNVWAKQLIIIPFAFATPRWGRTTMFVPFLVARENAKAKGTFKESTVNLGVLVAQISHERDYKFGFEGLYHLGRHDGGSHPAAGNGGNSVSVNIFLLPFDGKGVGKTQLSKLSGRVIGLSKVTVNA
jgi:hypothetical protein